MPLHLVSLFGWFVMIVFAWLISYNRKQFPWRTVIWGLGLQFTLALLILDTNWGKKIFEFAGDGESHFIPARPSPPAPRSNRKKKSSIWSSA